MKKTPLLFLVFILFFACDPDTNNDKGKDSKNKKNTEKEQSYEGGITADQKLRLTKILLDGKPSETFEYQNNKLTKWIAETTWTLSYYNGRLSKMEGWEENADEELEKVQEKEYFYENGRLHKIMQYEIDEDKKEATYRIEFVYKLGLLKEVRVYDLFEEETLEMRSVYSFRNNKIAQILNYNGGENPYEKIELEYWDAQSPYMTTGIRFLFDEFEPLNFIWAVKKRTTTKLPSGNTITEDWENSTIENGILKKGVLTLPRTEKPLTYEYIYQSF